jgi:hypothetical protein
MAEHRTRQLGKEPLDEIEPRAVLGREGKGKAPNRLGGEPSRRLTRDMRSACPASRALALWRLPFPERPVARQKRLVYVELFNPIDIIGGE